jgi:F-type H+-transporting ATPase subunit delta
MAELVTVARPYAEAAFRTAVEAGAVESYEHALAAMGVAASMPEAAGFLGNPKLSAAEKLAVLAASAGKGAALPAPLANLVSALLENGKAVLLPFVSEHFARLKRDHDGVVKAIIISAFPMSDADKADMVEALGRKYGRKVEAEVRVDQSLIGGARVQVGDDVVHASVRDMLDKMKQSLAA